MTSKWLADDVNEAMRAWTLVLVQLDPLYV
jgi:hypothetical protein